MRRLFRSGLLLTLILLAAAGLRLWYASAQLHINRFEDEKYSLQNVRKIYHTGDFAPASGYYPSPVFNLPQVWLLRAGEKVHELTGREALDAVGEKGRLEPAGFFLTRLYQALCGVLTLPLVYLVGRLLFSGRVGLLAALLLAFLPWTIHSSGYNKPDALLLFGVCLATYTSLRAAAGGRAMDHVFAGLAIALAMSAKLTGGLTAIPLVAATLFHLRGPERLRRLGLLALAGSTSALAFIAVNPYWHAYLHFIRGLQRDYAGRTEASRFEIPLRVAEMHLDDSLFGPVLGALALLAFAALAATWLRGALAARNARGEEAQETRQRTVLLAMFLAFPVAYTAAFAAQTSYFKVNNFLPVLPFTGLALAWLLDAAARRAAAWLEGRSAPATRRLLGVAAAAALTLALFVPGFLYVYRSVVPTTYDVARLWLNQHLAPRAGRLVYRDAWAAPELPWDGTRQLHQGRSAELDADDVLDEVPPAELELADAVVLRLDRRAQRPEALRGVGAWGESLTVEPRLLRLRGPALFAGTGGWRHLESFGADAAPCGEACFTAELPGSIAPESFVTVFVWLPTSFAPAAAPPELILRDAAGERRRSAFHAASRKGPGHLFVSRRFPASWFSEAPRFEAREAFGPGLEAVQVEIHLWQRAAFEVSRSRRGVDRLTRVESDVEISPPS